MNRQCGMQIQVCKNETPMALRVLSLLSQSFISHEIFV